MILDITQEDCDKGKKEDGHYCPTARCLARQFDVPMSHVFVDYGKMYVYDGSYRSYSFSVNRVAAFRSPRRLQKMVREFDTCSPFKPGRYAVYSIPNDD